MLAIKNNPYRILGVLVGSSTREQLNRSKKLKMYIEAEQEPDEDFCFPILGDVVRTIDTLNEAPAKLNLNKDRIYAAIFWFLNHSIADEPAFNALKDSDKLTAISIWSKLMSSNEVTSRNYSAFQNLSTLQLNSAFQNGQVELYLLEEGLSMKLKFLESDFCQHLVHLAADENYSLSKDELEMIFLRAVYEESLKAGITSQKFISIVYKMEFSAKAQFLQGFVHEIIERIEKSIEKTKQSRKAQPDKAASTGSVLYSDSLQPLGQLKRILGPSDLKFGSLSDKIAEEVLQCGIDYFKHFRDSSFDPGTIAMGCLQKAKIVAVGNVTKQRCQENIHNLQAWIDEKPNREIQQRITSDLTRITSLIDEYAIKPKTIANAKNILERSRQPIRNVKAVTGADNELYLGLSTRIASDAQGMLVAEINAIQNRLSVAFEHLTKLEAIVLLKQKVDEAWGVTLLIGSMDLRSDFKIHFNTNKQSLSELRSQLANIPVGSSSQSSSSRSGSQGSSGSSGGGGCYIATMAYGDYCHPQVIALRKFRDNVLSKSNAGKWFIRTYYRYSPKLVSMLKDKRHANACIRFILNQIIKLISR